MSQSSDYLPNQISNLTDQLISRTEQLLAITEPLKKYLQPEEYEVWQEISAKTADVRQTLEMQKLEGSG